MTMILQNSNTTGNIQANVDEWIKVSYKISRNKVKKAKKLKGIDNSGVYILLEVDEKNKRE